MTAVRPQSYLYFLKMQDWGISVEPEPNDGARVLGERKVVDREEVSTVRSEVIVELPIRGVSVHPLPMNTMRAPSPQSRLWAYHFCMPNRDDHLPFYTWER